MKMIMDDDAIEAIVSMLMELQEQDNTNIPLYERQLQETNTKIRNLINAIQQGVLTKSTKESLEELEAAKEELETRLANEQLSKPPKISAEFMTFWLHRFRKLDVTKQSHRKMLIDTFINAIYLYDDKMLITFNYKDGTKKITFSEIQEASKRDASGSDLECSPAPCRSKLRIACSDFFAKVRARSRRCSSFPNQTRYAGLRFGIWVQTRKLRHLYCCDGSTWSQSRTLRPRLFMSMAKNPHPLTPYSQITTAAVDCILLILFRIS